jgi:hypothetical protein
MVATVYVKSTKANSKPFIVKVPDSSTIAEVIILVAQTLRILDSVTVYGRSVVHILNIDGTAYEIDENALEKFGNRGAKSKDAVLFSEPPEEPQPTGTTNESTQG